MRLEFVAGKAAQEYVKKHEAELAKISAEKAAKERRDKERTERKEQVKKEIPSIVEAFSKSRIGSNIAPPGIFYTSKSRKFCYVDNDQYDEFFHLTLGKHLIKKHPDIVYCGIFEENNLTRVIIFAGDEASKNKSAADIARAVSQILGGSGGGNATFAQGGGPDQSKKDEAVNKAKSMAED